MLDLCAWVGEWVGGVVGFSDFEELVESVGYRRRTGESGALWMKWGLLTPPLPSPVPSAALAH